MAANAAIDAGSATLEPGRVAGYDICGQGRKTVVREYEVQADPNTKQIRGQLRRSRSLADGALVTDNSRLSVAPTIVRNEKTRNCRCCA